MRYRFTKMHGIGNDYVYINCFEQEVKNPAGLSVIVSDRHYGIGSDGLILIGPSDKADAKMTMFNADGSEGKMCGNGIRCVGKFLYDKGIVRKETVWVETKSGVKELRLHPRDGCVETVTVNMGKAGLSASSIPVLFEKETVIGEPVAIGEEVYRVTCVSMGNPHCVVFCEDVDSLKLEQIGPEFENHPMFPERVNTEFVRCIDEHTIQMRVWERGSGETLACGTGACASAVASILNGRCGREKAVTVKLRGGELEVCYLADGTVQMTGSATEVFEGSINVCGGEDE